MLPYNLEWTFKFLALMVINSIVTVLLTPDGVCWVWFGFTAFCGGMACWAYRDFLKEQEESKKRVEEFFNIVKTWTNY